MTTATITKTENYIVNLDSPLWPENMTDEDKLMAWVYGARQEPEVAFAYLQPHDVKIEGEIDE